MLSIPAVYLASFFIKFKITPAPQFDSKTFLFLILIKEIILLMPRDIQAMPSLSLYISAIY